MDNCDSFMDTCNDLNLDPQSDIFSLLSETTPTYPSSPLSSPFGTSDLSSPDQVHTHHEFSEVLQLDPNFVADMNFFDTQDFQSVIQMGDITQQGLDLTQNSTPSSDSVSITIDSPQEEEKPKRGRKRQRKNPDESDDVTAVVIPRDDLLKISSQEYDNIIKNITTSRPLTFSESKEMKVQRRLIKNRESASASRQRKKVQLDSLGTQNEALVAENARLSSMINGLQAENRSLKAELSKISALVKKTTLSTPINPNKVKGGIVLLIALFSFGLLFMNQQQTPSGISYRPNAATPNVAMVNTGGRRILEFESLDNRSIQPDVESPVSKSPVSKSPSAPVFLSSVKPDDELESLQESLAARVPAPESISETAPESRPVVVEHKTDRYYQKERSPIRIPVDDAPTLHDPKAFAARIHEFSNDSNKIIPTNYTIIDDERFTSLFNEGLIKYKRNTVYFTCETFHQLTPPMSEPFDEDLPFYISFVVPTTSLHNRAIPLISNKDHDGAIMEINSQVIDVNIVPTIF